MLLFFTHKTALSTHILTRRMTGNEYLLYNQNLLSTHILTRRMTSRISSFATFSILSTHILTRRMTLIHKRNGCYHGLSTHILTRRMTITDLSFHRTNSSFNSHPHKEDDGSTMCFSKPLERLSTHILTRRMTMMLFIRQGRLFFQLTSSQGG